MLVFRVFAGVFTGFILLVASTVSGFAHPHIWIDARVTVVFDDQGAITALKHEWVFDQAFSSWAIQGLDTNNDGTTSSAELQELADEYMVGLKDYDYYTFAGEGADDMAFLPGTGSTMIYDGARTTLTFTLPVAMPRAMPGPIEIEVADPEYYAAITFLTDRGVTLENAPQSCVAENNPPKAIDPAIEQRLFELGTDVTELPADLKDAAADLANVVIVHCPDLKPQSAVAAAEQAARSGGSPFAAPPPERGLPMARDGFFGWVNAQQRVFYGALTDALGRLKNDGNAFWVLGLLSFLYGIFHAAGPGHGKVVVSSYVLATEAELVRGVALSFASALMQAVTAVVFVLVAGLALNMTSSSLSHVSGFIISGSYLLVILLGLWLIARKVLGWGHVHHADAHHSHGEHHEHSHAVAPQATRGGVREMAGVVLAVGLRPCSGALIVLVFALSQGVFLAGIAAVFLMALGTAITVSLLAMLAVGVKGIGRYFEGGPNADVARSVLWWVELAGAILVLVFGLILFFANL